MLSIFVFTLFLSICEFNTSNAIPAGALLGCATLDSSSTIDQVKNCCDSFKIGCDRLKKMNEREKIQMNSNERKLNRKKRRKLLRTRLMGERCDDRVFVCGIGLKCSENYCRKIRTESHLNALLDRGKEVEQEEEEEAKQETSFLNLDSEKDIVVKGQAVSVSNKLNRKKGDGAKIDLESDNPNNEEGVLDINDIQDPGVKKMMRQLNLSKLSTKVNPGRKMKENNNFEEDEITSNIADLLSAKMGVSLDKAERHAIREIIAGTLDERAEREEAMEESEDKIYDASLETEKMQDSTPCAKPKRNKPTANDRRRPNVSREVAGMQCKANNNKYSLTNALEEARHIVRASTKDVSSVAF